MDGHIIALILQMESRGLEVSDLKVPPRAFTCRISWFESSIHSKAIWVPQRRKIFDPDTGHQDMRMLHGRAAPNSSYQMSVQIPSRPLNVADPVLIRLASAQHGGRASLWWRVGKDFWWEFFMEDKVFYPQRLTNRREKPCLMIVQKCGHGVSEQMHGFFISLMFPFYLA